MSTKSTIFLTRDNEHFYKECLDDSIVMEFSKNNINILINDTDDLVIEIKPGTELHHILKTNLNKKP